jgi:hypothetical protein
VKNWLKALLSETVLSVWWVLSAFGTVSTYLLPGLSGKPRLALAASAILGFAWANFRVFRKQERLISDLRQGRQLHEARTTELTIAPRRGSRYILRRAPSKVLHQDFDAMYLEFHLMIENSGRRSSVVNGFEVEILELGRTFPNLTPEEQLNFVYGRHCTQGLNTSSILSRTGLIRIEAENTTNHGSLIFYVQGVSPEMFVERGLHMTGKQRKLPPLHCRLTVTDTTGSSARAEFELHEE